MSEDSDSEVQKEVFKDDYVIKPSKDKAKLNTEDWPLLLKVIIILRFNVIIIILKFFFNFPNRKYILFNSLQLH